MPEQGNDARTWLTIEEVAARLQVHHNTVRRAIKMKELEAIRMGKGYRITEEALQRFIDRRNTLINIAA